MSERPPIEVRTDWGDLSLTEAESVASIHRSAGWPALLRLLNRARADEVSTVMSGKTGIDGVNYARGRHDAFADVEAALGAAIPTAFAVASAEAMKRVEEDASGEAPESSP